MSGATATLKLFALLGSRLPPGSTANATTVTLGDDTSLAQVIADYGLADKECHLVLLNGNFVGPDLRVLTRVAPGDVISIWPPVGGG